MFNRKLKKKKHAVAIKRKRNSIYSSIAKVYRNVWVKRITFSLLVGVIVIGSGIWVSQLFVKGYFNIKKVQIISETSYSYEEIQKYTASLEGQNIFLSRPTLIQSDLSSKSIFIKEIVVEKKLPDTIIIHLTERVPSFEFINLNGEFLLDKDGVVIDIVKLFPQFTLSERDKDILHGYFSITSSDNSISISTDNEVNSDNSIDTDNLSEKEKAQLKLEEQQQIEKKNQELRENLKQERQLVLSKVHNLWREEVSDDQVATIRFRVFSYLDHSYETGEILSKDIFDTVVYIISTEWKDLTPTQYTLESEVRFRVDTEEGTVVYFSVDDVGNRPAKVQIEDLSVVLEEAYFRGKIYSKIDVGSEKILVQE